MYWGSGKWRELGGVIDLPKFVFANTGHQMKDHTPQYQHPGTCSGHQQELEAQLNICAFNYNRVTHCCLGIQWPCPRVGHQWLPNNGDSSTNAHIPQLSPSTVPLLLAYSSMWTAMYPRLPDKPQGLCLKLWWYQPCIGQQERNMFHQLPKTWNNKMEMILNF